MVFCPNCGIEVEAEEDYAEGYSYCVTCGTVLEDGTFASSLTFTKGAGGESGMVGQMVTEGSSQYRSLVSSDGDPFLSDQSRGRSEITLLVNQLNIRPQEDTIEAALRLYKLAVHRDFLRGRRANMVAASCIYIICRHDKKPYLLIDFSDVLGINLFALGSVFLEASRLFQLHAHPMITNPVDPSLFIHRYADKLQFGKKTTAIVHTALMLIKSMKRDWIQTGRRPSGLCGAALLLAAQAHGVKRQKRDIVHVVHIGVNTVAKRMVEFSQTKSGKLTVQEFETRALKFEEEEQLLMKQLTERAEKEKETDKDNEGGLDGKPSCHHIVAGEDHFAQGMCKACFIEYMKISGGIVEGASDPPCYTSNLRKAKEAAMRKKLKSAKSARIKKKMMKMLEDLDDDEEEDEDDLHSVDEVEDEMNQALQTEELMSIVKVLPESEEVLAGATRKRKSPTEPTTAEPVLNAELDAAGPSQRDDVQEGDNDDEAGPSQPPTLPETSASPQAPLTPEENEVQRNVWGTFPGDNLDDLVRAGQEDDLKKQEEDGSSENEKEMGKKEKNGEVEIDSLSDIDDEEIDTYVRTADEAKQKEEWWNEMYKEYLEKEAIKQQQMQEAAEAKGDLSGNEPKRKKRKKWDKLSGEASSALEAVKDALEQRGLSRKVNYNNLETLFEFPKDCHGDEGEGEEGEAREELSAREEERRAKQREEEEGQRSALETERMGGRTSGFLSALSHRRNNPRYQSRGNRLEGLNF